MQPFLLQIFAVQGAHMVVIQPMDHTQTQPCMQALPPQGFVLQCTGRVMRMQTQLSTGCHVPQVANSKAKPISTLQVSKYSKSASSMHCICACLICICA